MMNNIHIIERLAEVELESARAEGMRSQMLAREGLTRPWKLSLPDLRRFYQQRIGGWFNHRKAPCIDRAGVINQG